MTTKDVIYSGIDLTAMQTAVSTQAQQIAALQAAVAALPAPFDPTSINQQIASINSQLALLKQITVNVTGGSAPADLTALIAAVSSIATAIAALPTAPSSGTGSGASPPPAPPPPTTTAVISNPNSGVTLKPGVVFTGDAMGTASDPNVYPLTVAPAAAGSTRDVGTGPNVVTIVASRNPASGGVPNAFTLTLTKQDGSQHAIAVDVDVPSDVGATVAGSDVYRFHGPWGSNPQMTITSPDNGVGLVNWINDVTLDGVPFPIWSLDNSRGGGTEGGTQTFNSNQASMTLMFAANVYVAPPPPSTTGTTGGNPTYGATPSQIAGATLNGAAAGTDTLKNLLAANQDLVLPAGHFLGTGASGANVTGAGIQTTIIDCTGLEPAQDKGIIVPTVTGKTIKTLSLTGAAISDALGANAAGSRPAGDGIDTTYDTVEFYGNQNGYLGFNGSTTFINCHAHDNGVPPTDANVGYEHDIYCNGPCIIHGGLFEKPMGAHAVKVRGPSLVADQGAVIVSGPDGSCIDMPWGGTCNLDGITLTKPSGSNDHNIVTLGMEGANNGPTTGTWNNVTINDPDGVGIMQGANGATINCTGTITYVGPKLPQISGVVFTGVPWTLKAA